VGNGLEYFGEKMAQDVFVVSLQQRHSINENRNHRTTKKEHLPLASILLYLPMDS